MSEDLRVEIKALHWNAYNAETDLVGTLNAMFYKNRMVYSLSNLAEPYSQLDLFYSFKSLYFEILVGEEQVGSIHGDVNGREINFWCMINGTSVGEHHYNDLQEALDDCFVGYSVEEVAAV